MEDAVDPKETIAHILQLCEESKDNPQYLTFHQIAEWAEKQLKAYDAVNLSVAQPA